MKRGDDKLLWSKIYLSQKKEDKGQSTEEGKHRRRGKASTLSTVASRLYVWQKQTKPPPGKWYVHFQWEIHSLTSQLKPHGSRKVQQFVSSSYGQGEHLLSAEWPWMGRDISVQGRQRSRSLCNCYPQSLLQNPCSVCITVACMGTGPSNKLTAVSPGEGVERPLQDAGNNCESSVSL